MQEHDTLRLVQALVISRVTYGLPYHFLSREEERQVDIIIRSAYKAALGLPKGTSTDRLLALGVHNTFEELKQATLISQRERLSYTHAGRALLTRARISPHPQFISEHVLPLPTSTRARITVAPYPKTCTLNTIKQGEKHAHNILEQCMKIIPRTTQYTQTQPRIRTYTRTPVMPKRTSGGTQWQSSTRKHSNNLRHPSRQVLRRLPKLSPWQWPSLTRNARKRASP